MSPSTSEPLLLAPPTKVKHARYVVLFSILILLMVIGGTIWWMNAQSYESTDDAFIDAHIVRIAPQIAGRVVTVAVNDNQDVKKGDLLIEIDPADYQAKLDQALAHRDASLSALTQAQAQLTAAEANVLESQAFMDAAETYAKNTATKDTRNQRLAAKMLISRQQLEDSEANTKIDDSMFEAARKKKDASVAQTTVSKTQIAAAEADIKSSDAEVEQAQLNLSYTKIFAPQDGRVTKKNVSIGDYLEVGQQFMLLTPPQVWVTANFKENQLNHIHPGQPVDIKIDAYPDHLFVGRVDSIESGSGAAFSLLPPENATGNYIKIVQRVPIKITFDDAIDPQYHLGPGMSVVPTINIQ